MTTYIFPGQGSQMTGMGAGVFKQFSEIVRKADAILGFSIESLCLDGGEKLNQTQYTQPALYIVNTLMYFEKLQKNSGKPNYVAGHSLGEYNALLAAEVFDFETGLKLVIKRGELMSQETGGAMTAVVGLKKYEVESILASQALNVSIANDNSHTQFVISGQKKDVQLAQTACELAGAQLVVPLKVSGAFHSSYMQTAKEEFANFLKEFSFARPNIPVIANYTAKPYQVNDIQKYLSLQITHPVRWTESINYLLAQGETEFEEIGPGRVLTGLVRRIRNDQ